MAITPSLVLGIELAACLFLLYAIGSVVYNLYFHPLRDIPGPRLAAATDFPFIFNRCFGLQVRWIKQLHDKYGEVVRVAPTQLSYSSAGAWKDIYGHRIAGKPALPKDLSFYGPDLVGSNGITRANEEDHARQRRLLSHAFSEKALHDHQPLIQRHIDVLIKKLGEPAASEGVDMTRMYTYCLFDTIADLLFGASLNMLESPEYRPWATALIGAVKTFSLLPAIKASYPVFSTILRRIFVPAQLFKELDLHGEFTRHFIDSRLKEGKSKQDIWSYVVDPNGDGKGLPLHEMYAIGGVLMGAGGETSSTLLSGLTYYLLRHPDKMAALTAEVRGAFRDPSEMDSVQLAQLPYLRACIQEALRVYPPAATGMPRVVPPGGSVIAGKTIAAGTTVYVSPFAAHRSSANFYEPDKFLPERWLDAPDPKYANDVFDVVQPFLYGPRNCIGKNLAYIMMRRILANVLWHYDLELCPEVGDWEDQIVFTNWQKPPLMCKLKPVVRE